MNNNVWVVCYLPNNKEHPNEPLAAFSSLEKAEEWAHFPTGRKYYYIMRLMVDADD